MLSKLNKAIIDTYCTVYPDYVEKFERCIHPKTVDHLIFFCSHFNWERFFPGWTLRALCMSCSYNDKQSVGQILDLMDNILTMSSPCFISAGRSNSQPILPQMADGYALNKRLLSNLKRELLGISDTPIPADNDYKGLFERLSDYDPRLPNNAERVVSSLDDICRPGQCIPVDVVNKMFDSMPRKAPGDDVLFIKNNPSSEWVFTWRRSDDIFYPIWPFSEPQHPDYIARDTLEGVQGTLLEYHTYDDAKTLSRLQSYIDAGFGWGKRKKVIFVEHEGYYVCLGLAELDEFDAQSPHLSHTPACLWVFPAFR